MTENQVTKRAHNFKDLTDQRFGRLTVVENTPAQYASGTCRGATMWRCLCDCASIVIVSYSNLKSGATQSCGCQRRDNGKAKRTHGMVTTPEYESWQHAKSRCFNPNDKAFASYGGRGISMCAEWVQSFQAFYQDMGPKPTRHHSIDRIDNDGPYAPGNCRWATVKQQNNNRRKRRIYPPKVGRYWSKT